MVRATWLAGVLALALSACAETRPTHTNGNGNGGGVNPPDSLDRVLSRTFTVPAFKLESGVVLPELTLAHETYGSRPTAATRSWSRTASRAATTPPASTRIPTRRPAGGTG